MKTTGSMEINIESLSVRYPGGIQALDGIDLRIGPGLFGLLGPNGAGKSTLMRVLATILRPTSGVARVFGFDVERDSREVRRLLGYLPQDFQTYRQLRVREALNYYGILGGMEDRKARRKRGEEVLSRVGLGEQAARRVGSLSGGMLQRLGVAQALLADPRFLIFDEPTAGLDPAERVHFRNFLGELSRDRVIILSTHIVADVGSACDRLAVLNRGRLAFLGGRDELMEKAAGKVWQMVVSDMDYEALRARYPITSMRDSSRGLTVRLLSESREDDRWEEVEPNLEDAYLWLIQPGVRSRVGNGNGRAD